MKERRFVSLVLHSLSVSHKMTNNSQGRGFYRLFNDALFYTLLSEGDGGGWRRGFVTLIS